MENLTISGEYFFSHLNEVTDDDLSSATPCQEWNVAHLVWHVARASDMTVLLLNGGTKVEATELFAHDVPDHLVHECRRALETERSEFESSQELDMIVHHPLGEVSVQQLFDFRIMDLTLHGWDLARALGADEEIPASLVTYVYEMLLPLEPVIDQIGIFGTGPSRSLEDSATMQHKLLDLSGRRS